MGWRMLGDHADSGTGHGSVTSWLQINVTVRSCHSLHNSNLDRHCWHSFV
jgi:hypothetical protein